MADHEDTLLTRFQIEVANLFFALPASDGFLLAGGAALLAQHVTARPTHDLDFLTRHGGGDVGRARDKLVAAASMRGWTVDTVRDNDTFCRLLVHGPEDLLVDLALDSAPGRPAAVSIAGPTFARRSSPGGRWSLSSIAPPRVTSSTCTHCTTPFPKDVLLERAAEVDAGFNRAVFAEMLEHLTRYGDIDLALGAVDITQLGMFFQQWVVELRTHSK